MKTKIQNCGLVFLALALLPSVGITSAFAQGTAFTYQGRLTVGTNAVTGKFDLRFYLRDALVGGNPVGSTNTLAPVGVTNGLFTATLDFGAGIFAGPARWLEVGVRTNGSVGAYTTLVPRQPLTAAPYAIMAGNSGNLGGQPATAFAPNSGSSSYVARAGDTMSGSLNLPGSAVLGFGNTTRQMLNLYQTGYGIGVQDFTVYQRSSGGFAWYLGGVHNDAQNNPGANGTTLMTLDAYGDLSATGQVVAANGIVGNSSTLFGSGVLGNDTSGLTNSTGVYGNSAVGKGVFGLSSGNSPISAGVWGENPIAGGTAVVAKAAGAGSTGLFASGTGNAGYFQGNVAVTGAESFGNTTRQMLDLWSTSYGIGVQNSAFYQRTGNEFFWYKGGTHSDTFADPGAGGTQLMRLGNSGTLSVGGVVTPTIQLSGAPGLNFGSATRQMINLYNLPDGTSYAVGVQNNREYFRAGGTNGSGFAWFAGGSHVDAQDNAGPGGVQLMKLEYGPMDGCAGSGGGKFCGPGAILYVWGSVWSLDSSYAYSFESLSDRDQKSAFEPLDAQEILGRVVALPVTSWVFTNHTEIRHIGPMAQDFHAAFQVGMDDRHISATDETGVALAAIQGLNQKLESELKTKETEIGELNRRLAQLETLLSKSGSR